MHPLADLRDWIEAAAHARPVLPDGINRITDVCVIASASRGGSSVFAELLRRADRFLHLRGEMNPFLRLAGLAFPESGTDSDALGTEHASAGGTLSRLLAVDLGSPATHLDTPEEIDRFATDLGLRLALQWPGSAFDPAAVRHWTRDTLGDVTPIAGGLPGEFRCAFEFHLRFLRRVRAQHPEVNPYRYDLPPARVREAFPDVAIPREPPAAVCEEPPFLAIGPWQLPSAADLATRTLILKAPSDAYQLPFLRQLFSAARFRVIHLTRNAAAAINGLLDGWVHHGFHSHHVPVRLRIRGYSDVVMGGDSWWKFDLPPGWRGVTNRPLVEVCAFQWLAAHRSIRDFTAGLPPADTLRFPFEDMIGEPARREAALTRLATWLGIPAGSLIQAVAADMPPIMATTPPRNGRWQDRAGELASVLKCPEVRRMIEELGYADDPTRWL